MRPQIEAANTTTRQFESPRRRITYKDDFKPQYHELKVTASITYVINRTLNGMNKKWKHKQV